MKYYGNTKSLETWDNSSTMFSRKLLAHKHVTKLLVTRELYKAKNAPIEQIAMQFR